MSEERVHEEEEDMVEVEAVTHQPLKKLRKGLCAALGDNILTYSEKGAADQLSITLRQIVKHNRNFMDKKSATRYTTKQRLLLSSRFMIKTC